MAGFLFDPQASTLNGPTPQSTATGYDATQGFNPYMQLGLGTAQSPATAYTNAANAVQDTGPASSLIKGYLVGKSVSVSDHLGQYENNLKQQAEALRVQKQKAELYQKAQDQATQDLQLYYQQAAPLALSNNYELASKTLGDALNKNIVYTNQAMGKRLQYTDVQVIPGTDNYTANLIDLDTGQSYKQDGNRRQLVASVLAPDARQAVFGDQLNSKPVPISFVDSAGITQQNVPASVGADGIYRTTNGVVVDASKMLSVDGQPTPLLLQQMQAAQGGQPQGTSTVAPTAPTGAVDPTALKTPNMPSTEAGLNLPPVEGITGGASIAGAGTPQLQAVLGDAAMPAPQNPAALPDTQAPQGLPANIFKAEDTKEGPRYKLDLGFEKGGPAPISTNPKAQLQYRSELEGNQQYKDFSKALGSFENAVNLAQDKNGASDIGLVFNVMKAFDPQSTVREGEFKTLQDAQNTIAKSETLGTNAKNVLANLLQDAEAKSTNGKFTPETRAEFLQAAYSNMVGYGQSALRAVGPRVEEMKTGGIDPRFVLSFDADKVSQFLTNPPDFKALAATGETSEVPKGIQAKVDAMTPEQREARIKELQAKLGQ